MPNPNDVIISNGTNWNAISSEDYAAIVNPFISGGGGGGGGTGFVPLGGTYGMSGRFSTGVAQDTPTQSSFNMSSSSFNIITQRNIGDQDFGQISLGSYYVNLIVEHNGISDSIRRFSLFQGSPFTFSGDIAVYQDMVEADIAVKINNNSSSLITRQYADDKYAGTVITTATTAKNSTTYHTEGIFTITDPDGVEGKGYDVLVLTGEVTVGGTSYSTAGTYIRRRFVSGSWENYVGVGGGGGVDKYLSTQRTSLSAITGTSKSAIWGADYGSLTIKPDFINYVGAIIKTEHQHSVDVGVTAGNFKLELDWGGTEIADTGNLAFPLSAGAYKVTTSVRVDTIIAGASGQLDGRIECELVNTSGVPIKRVYDFSTSSVNVTAAQTLVLSLTMDTAATNSWVSQRGDIR